MTGAALATAFAPEDIKKVVAVFAQVDNRGGGVEELAEAADLPLSAVQAMMDDAATVPRFLAAQRRAGAGGVRLGSPGGGTDPFAWLARRNAFHR